MHVGSFLNSIEVIVLLMLITKHFQIRTQNDQRLEDEDAYDELQGEILANLEG